MNLDFDPKKNYYDILWVSEDASDDDIKKAYRKAAMKYHPDRNKWDATAEEKFKEINEANEVLSDSSKKQQYNAFRNGGGGFWGFGGAWGGANFWGFGWWAQFGWVDLWDLIWGMFGGWWGRRTGPRQWEDLVLQLTIWFEDAYHGITKKVSYTRSVQWEWIDEKICDTCGGAWVVAQQVRTPFGVMQSQWACPECDGAGRSYTKDGKTVGNGWLEETKQDIQIKIPAGIKAGSKIRYPGMGNDGLYGGPEGDLYVKILVRWSDKRRRDGDNLLTEVDITIYDAVLWSEMEVPHPEWPVTVKIPKGLQVGERIRVSNKWYGDKWLLKSRGDMVVIPNMKIPKRLSKSQEKLWKELRGEK